MKFKVNNKVEKWMKKGAKGRFQEGAHPLSSPLHHSQEESEGMKTR